MGDIFNPEDEIKKLNENYRRDLIFTVMQMSEVEQKAFALGQEKTLNYVEEYMAIQSMDQMSKMTDKEFERLMQLKMANDDMKGWGW